MRRDGCVTVLVIIVVGAGLLIGLYNTVRMFYRLAMYSHWTGGTYQEPISTTISLVGGIVFLVLALALAVAIVVILVTGRAREADSSEWKAILGVFAASVVFGLSSITAPYIRVGEIDVTANGFLQARYSTVTWESFRLYNATQIPVRVCLGSQGQCTTYDKSLLVPKELRAPGLTLAPGSHAEVTFEDGGEYPITVIGLPTDATQVDAVAEVFVPLDNPEWPGER